MRTCLRAGAGAVLALGILTAPAILAASASAAPYVVDPKTAVNTSNPDVGGQLTVFGTGWGDSQVRVDLHSKVVTLGTVNVGTDGTFSATFTLPATFTCRHKVSTTGLTSHRVTHNKIVIGTCRGVEGVDRGQSAGGGSGSGGGDRSDLPRTGAAAAGVGLAGLALLGSGVALRRAARRR